MATRKAQAFSLKRIFLRSTLVSTALWYLLIIVLSELIDKITVGEAKMVDDEKQVDVTIYYRFIGTVQ